jgi:zinc transporter ZupT
MTRTPTPPNPHYTRPRAAFPAATMTCPPCCPLVAPPSARTVFCVLCCIACMSGCYAVDARDMRSIAVVPPRRNLLSTHNATAPEIASGGAYTIDAHSLKITSGNLTAGDCLDAFSGVFGEDINAWKVTYADHAAEPPGAHDAHAEEEEGLPTSPVIKKCATCPKHSATYAYQADNKTVEASVTLAVPAGERRGACTVTAVKVAPAAPAHVDGKGSIGMAMLASFVTCVCSIIGVGVVLALKVVKSEGSQYVMDLLGAIGGGAMFSAAVFHVIPEALNREFLGTLSEANVRWSSGGMAILAIIIGVSIEVIADHHSHHHHQHCEGAGGDVAMVVIHNGNEEGGNIVIHHSPVEGAAPAVHSKIEPAPAVQKPAAAVAPHALSIGAAWNVNVGDTVHNFVDGVLIGIAFASCNSTIGWTVTTAIILHELPTEVGNFVVLQASGFSNLKALAFNFISSLAALIGTAISASSTKAIGPVLTGCLLAFGGYNFLFISLTEIMPHILAQSKLEKRIILLAAMAFGVLVVALSLLNGDTHCDPPAATVGTVAAGGDGHGH